MTNCQTSLWNMGVNHIGNALQVVDTRIDEIDLPVARHLEINSLSYDFRAEGMNLCLNGIAIRGRCLYDAQVASAEQRKLEGTGNRCRRKCQGIDIGFHLSELFLG